MAIDHILDSPWGSDKEGTKKKQPRLETREAVVECLQRMLELKFFHRARKVGNSYNCFLYCRLQLVKQNPLGIVQVPITERDLRRRALKKFKEEKESEATKKKSKKETDEVSVTYYLSRLRIEWCNEYTVKAQNTGFFRQ